MADKPRSGPSMAPATQPVDRTLPKAPVEGARGAEGTASAEAVTRAQGAAAAAKVGEVSGVGAAGQVAKASGSERIGEIARRLRGGELTVSQAVEELIEDAVQRSLPGAQRGQPGAGEDSKMRAALRAALRAYVLDDPLLSARVQRLTGGKKR